MDDLQELKYAIARAILDRDEAAFRVSVVDIWKLPSPQAQRLLESAFNYVSDIEMGIDGTVWASNIIPTMFSKQEAAQSREDAKQYIIQKLEAAGYELGEDYSITPNGSTRLISDKAREALRNAISDNLWQTLLWHRIIRIPKSL